MEKTLKFRLRNETKGAARYEELDEAGRVVEMENAVIGTLYIRKHTFEGTIPQTLEVAVRYA